MFESMLFPLVGILLWKALVIYYGYKLGKEWNRLSEGILYSFVFDLFGLAILWMMGPEVQKCPACGRVNKGPKKLRCECGWRMRLSQ
ncbi:hypothetical protein [Pelagicoccus enzymogenes]|uniref:hypothetical protein n=1 Tax=Pelagicoccus enzymogenes TaxID=2773457 RepID=UPI0028114432|nr:hypothetical protein [Pelagicoccus enzymogenes]